MKNRLAALVLSFATGSSFAAAKLDLTKLPPPVDKPGLTYEKDIRPLFEASCFRCHGEQRPRADLRLDSRQAALKGSEDGKVILPGNSRDSILVHSIAQLNDDIAMPPKGNSNDGPRGRVSRDTNAPGGFARPGGTRGPRGTNGPPGRGGFGFGIGAGNELAARLITDGDKNADKKLTKEEMLAVAGLWFAKFDTNQTGRVTAEQFSERSADVFPRGQGGFGGFGGGGPMGGGQRGGFGAGFGPPGGAQTNAAGGPGPRRGGGGSFGMGGRSFAPGLFGTLDLDKDGSLTKGEMTAAFTKWFSDWGKEKSGTLTEENLREGLNAALPRPDFGGFGGFGGPGRPGGPGGPGGGGDAGPRPMPLTPEQVGLVRAWIDQGAR